MPKLSDNRVPSYRLHRQSGQAVVTLNGKDILLGPHGTGASRSEYRRVTAEWLANGRQLPQAQPDLTIAELITRFRQFAVAYYRRSDGKTSSELNNFRDALRPVRQLYGATAAAKFGPLALRAVREQMIELGWCRTHINRHVGRVKHLFKWAAGRELVPASVHHALVAVEGLQAGRSEATESEPVKPVPDALVDAVLPYLSPQVRAMVELQMLTGCRPGEVCQMRTADIDTTGRLWTYKPQQHKTAHHGHERIIYMGPKAQEIIRPFLKTMLSAFCFSPAEAEQARREARHAQRKTPASCGNMPGDNRKASPKKSPGECFTVESYGRSIKSGCDAAFPPPEHLAQAKGETRRQWMARLKPKQLEELAQWRKQHHWHPHQLRHGAATKLRKEFGLEAAQVILGHKTLTVTQIYAEKNVEAAVKIMSEVG